MKGRGLVIIGIILTIAFVLGGSAASVVPKTVEVTPDPFQEFTFRQLLALSEEGLIDKSEVEMTEFVQKRRDQLKAAYEGFKEEDRKARLQVIEVLDAMPLNEVEEVRNEFDPRQAEQVLLIRTVRDGDTLIVPLDAAEWEDYFRRSLYGFGYNNCYKSYLYEGHFQHGR